jgi:hydrogenase nickel incorporation protein HypB
MAVRVLNIKEDILSSNDEKAKNNQKLLDKHSILMINIMSSPGAGKTSLILKTITMLKDKTRIAVVEGDIASTVDADKVSSLAVPVIQINTGGACHLDANMVAKALEILPLEKIDLLFIENVGNLVCTAEFALGEHKRIMLLSVPEGDDKPYKYPLMFTEADAVLISKIDMLPHFDFNINAFSEAVSGLNPGGIIFPSSSKTGEGMEAFYSWLLAEVKKRKAAKV